MTLPTTESITHSINKSFEKLYYTDEDGIFHPYVCVLCDRFLKFDEVKTIDIATLCSKKKFLRPTDQDNMNSLIQMDYKANERYLEEKEKKDLDELLLSPRAPFINRSNNSSGFCCCRSCEYGVYKNQMPKFAIANGFFFGTPPKELTELNQMELAMLTPVKAWGYCYTYTGGRARNLEGNLTYLPATQKQLVGDLNYQARSHEEISEAIARLEALGLNTDIVVILHGYMTPKQKQAAKLKNQVRVSKLMRALQWLVENNVEWKRKGINLDEIRRNLQTPALIDHSKYVPDSDDEANRNIEETQTFRVFFPDGSMNDLDGGQESIESFQQRVKEMKFSGFTTNVEYDIGGRFVYDYQDNNFVNACLLQFPYGRGGLHELRYRGDQSQTETFNQEEYLSHLASISQLHFHEELFCLIVYNMFVKSKMVKTATWRVRGGTSSRMLGEDLTVEEVETAISSRQRGVHSNGNNPGTEYVRAIDTLAQNVPHSNKAAKNAQKVAEAMQFQFGQPSWFLTVTPDDDNSFIMQIYSGKDIDITSADVEGITEEEAMKRATERTTLRLKYPGICAIFFQSALDIILKDVIGWDKDSKKHTTEKGLFGCPQAFTAAVEEQGRGTLHVHMLVWVKEFNQIRERLYAPSNKVQKMAKYELTNQIDSIITTELHGMAFPEQPNNIETTYKQKCTCDQPLQFCSDEEIRLLRHKSSYKEQIQKIAFCQPCGKTFSDHDLLRMYIGNIKGKKHYAESKDLIGRLKSETIKYQMPGGQTDESIVQAAYNKHIHCKGCFPVDKKRKRPSTYVVKDYECRYRQPKRAKRSTEIIPSTHQKIKWFHWDGTYKEQHMYEVNLRRSKLDIFQNESCTAISHSKLTCNTNVAALMPGPVTNYIFKYNMKGTQEDDEQAYSRVLVATKKSLNKEVDTETTAYSKSISRVLSAALAHEKTNVIRGTLASYLTKTGSRFIFSHNTVWCPLLDFDKFFHNQTVYTTIRTERKTVYRNSNCMNYVCRSKELETVNVWDFYSQYTPTKLTSTMRKNPKSHFPFINIPNYQHPSFIHEKQQFMMCIIAQENIALPKFSAYIFPDTARFKTSITEHTPVSTIGEDAGKAIEQYSMYALILFLPFRSKKDLQKDNSFHKKFQEVLHAGIISQEQKQILQNIQDYRANMGRYPSEQDDLQRCTKPFNPNINPTNTFTTTEKEDESSSTKQKNLEALLNALNENTPNNVTKNSQKIPEQMLMKNQKQAGKFRCAQSCVARMTGERIQNFFSTVNSQQQENASEQANTSNPPVRKYRQQDLIRVFLVRRTRRQFTGHSTEISESAIDRTVTRGRSSDMLLEANGSVQSIFDWAEKRKLDKEQRRAFEIFCATFVLSFYTECPQETSNDPHFLLQLQNLMKLVGKPGATQHQLLCFLHGPGGSGKSTVLDLFLCYSKQFCSFLEGFIFTTNTVRITAMSGVAATLIRGETTHSALYLNKRNPIGHEELEVWAETRMLIIDEISFASASSLKLIYQRLKDLKRGDAPYGGMNVIFAGDMYQLEPVVGDPLHKEHNVEFNDNINCFIELQGNHRFAQDPEWGELLRRFRLGEVTDEDLAKINERVVRHDRVPANIKYATYCNKDRDAINAALFEKHCFLKKNNENIATDAVAIYSDRVKICKTDKTYVDMKNLHHFWNTCGESNISETTTHGKMDPVLRLYAGCQVMFPYNKDVPNGIANGTQATVQKVNFKHGTATRFVVLGNNVKVRAVFASEIHSIIVKHVRADIVPNQFPVMPTQFTVTIGLLAPPRIQTKGNTREQVRIQCQQIPLLINNATTGHKLQGMGVDQLFVHEWRYQTNWPYVVLSRVKCLKGLFLRRALSHDKNKYKPPKSLIDMLQHMETKKVQYFTEEEYNAFPQTQTNTTQ